MTKDDGTLRTFETGATRDTAEGKLDMEGFTHPMVMKQFAKYMNMNRLQSDGSLRDSDNWQKGISKEAYMKSLRRHHDETWEEWRGFPSRNGMVATLCGIMFNAMGMLHEVLKDRDWKLQDFDGDEPTPEMQERIDAMNVTTCDPDFNEVEDDMQWIKENQFGLYKSREHNSCKCKSPGCGDCRDGE